MLHPSYPQLNPLLEQMKVIADWQGHQDGGKLILATYSHVRKTHADEMAQKLTLPAS